MSISLEAFFKKALDLKDPWYISKECLEDNGKQLHIHVNFKSDSKFPCANCGKYCNVIKTFEEAKIHKFIKMKTKIHYCTPLIKCDACGEKTAKVPWTKKSSNRMSSEELQNKAETGLCYVIRMLNETSNIIKKSKSAKNSAYIESFAIHARTLITFLHGDSDGKDSILASNFVDDWQLEDNDFLNDTRKKADKMAAHLTEGGLLWPDKEWNTIEIRNRINEEILEFLDAPDNKLSRETKTKIKEIVGKTALGPSGPDNDTKSINNGKGATGLPGP